MFKEFPGENPCAEEGLGSLGTRSAQKIPGKSPKTEFGAAASQSCLRMGIPAGSIGFLGFGEEGAANCQKFQGHLLVQGAVPTQGVHHSSGNLQRMGTDEGKMPENQRKSGIPEVPSMGQLGPGTSEFGVSLGGTEGS